ncbi:hypothetical protein HNP46_004170 [Pseudomonas nitritireducens]|uniref:Uncharacterized protein n=1 Tax=Pseudomonas nitroreducens TaxID=46680 RepID=A0A7W7KM26_PSENT|nr:hypothetical protein [Pseudomonas nitritireducens]MBB4865289.1 hypothetical protein [Pseudomonas nitritireducens]
MTGEKDDFRDRYYRKGWNRDTLAVRWDISVGTLSRHTNDFDRSQLWLDALNGLPQFSETKARAVPVPPEEFKAHFRSLGWTGKTLGERWGFNNEWVSRQAGDVNRHAYLNDALFALPRAPKNLKAPRASEKNTLQDANDKESRMNHAVIEKFVGAVNEDILAGWKEGMKGKLRAGRQLFDRLPPAALKGQHLKDWYAGHDGAQRLRATRVTFFITKGPDGQLITVKRQGWPNRGPVLSSMRKKYDCRDIRVTYFEDGEPKREYDCLS